ncbi:hypothetical protein TrLO_g1546 [Triparma laevis f. longispina]|uniref:Uncharacterized protein n=1 Tax=Triparma laevis f. longispina TaxID=1714387 RepID=A0A9W7L0J5_9STRA|nr:hypothetical protein TrLO_g1546 [Triparma laevis f. longispina]
MRVLILLALSLSTIRGFNLTPRTRTLVRGGSGALRSDLLTNTNDIPIGNLISEVDSLESSYMATPESRSDLYGDYAVLRTFNPSSPNPNSSNAAGGKWVRSNGITGRFFKVEGLFQNIVKEEGKPSAVNLVLLSFLSRLLCITVVLKGDCSFLTSSEITEIVSKRKTPNGLTSNSVRASFNSPMFRLSLLGYRSPFGVTFRLGPSSKVILDASYVDSKLRIGKGASGVRFILQRVTEGFKKDLWIPVVNSRFVVGKKGIIGGLMSAGLGLIFKGGRGLKVLGGLCVGFATVIVKSTGGIEEGKQAEV